MSPVGWIRNGLGALRAHRWGAECPDGTPVPSAERCAALDCDSVRLPALRQGDRGTVTCLESPGSRATGRLAAMGVLPGATIVLVQRSPVFVFRMGHAELAVDGALAARIRVRREVHTDFKLRSAPPA
ncbi:MAG: ferrous iron transport protein A [Gemmatimonadetes bacterium]|nr:ferrous iron transport protein A [Gemmatimonadota bacterium]